MLAGRGITGTVGVEALVFVVLVERVGQDGQRKHAQRTLAQGGLHLRGKGGFDVVVFDDLLQAVVSIGHVLQAGSGETCHQYEHDDKARDNMGSDAKVLFGLFHSFIIGRVSSKMPRGLSGEAG